MKLRLFLLSFVLFLQGHSQDYFPSNTGVKSPQNYYQAIVNATLHLNPTTTVENGSLLFKEGKIVAVGQAIDLPENTIIHDAKGKHLYASFIELHSTFGFPSQKSRSRRRSVQYTADREGYYWSDHIRADYNSIEDYTYKKDEAADFRKAGFGVVNTHRPEGIHRGTGVLVALNDVENDAQRLLDDKASQQLSFSKSSLSNQYYPGSIMGAMALLRQFFHDADWYAKGGAKNKDLAIEAYNNIKKLPAIFEANNKLDVTRAAKIGQEFNLPFVVTANGREYEHLQALKDFDASLLVPLAFPKAYDVTDPVSTQKIALSDLRYWNQAPANPAKIAAAKIPFALTTKGLKKKNSFYTQLKKAVAYGLDESTALAALTSRPAKILKKQKELGSLKKGAYANFIVTDGPLFAEATKIEENWVQGQQHKIVHQPEISLDGKYSLMLEGEKYQLEIKNSATKIAATVKQDSLSFKTKASYANGWLSLQLQNSDKSNYAQLNAKISSAEHLEGKATSFKGNRVDWMAHFEEALEVKVKKKQVQKLPCTRSGNISKQRIWFLLNVKRRRISYSKMRPFGQTKQKAYFPIPMYGWKTAKSNPLGKTFQLRV